MEITKEEFERNFNELHERLLEEMANHPEINLDKFSSMACYLENLSFFAPFLYGVLRESKK